MVDSPAVSNGDFRPSVRFARLNLASLIRGDVAALASPFAGIDGDLFGRHDRVDSIRDLMHGLNSLGGSYRDYLDVGKRVVDGLVTRDFSAAIQLFDSYSSRAYAELTTFEAKMMDLLSIWSGVHALSAERSSLEASVNIFEEAVREANARSAVHSQRAEKWDVFISKYFADEKIARVKTLATSSAIAGAWGFVQPTDSGMGFPVEWKVKKRIIRDIAGLCADELADRDLHLNKDLAEVSSWQERESSMIVTRSEDFKQKVDRLHKAAIADIDRRLDLERSKLETILSVDVLVNCAKRYALDYAISAYMGQVACNLIERRFAYGSRAAVIAGKFAAAFERVRESFDIRRSLHVFQGVRAFLDMLGTRVELTSFKLPVRFSAGEAEAIVNFASPLPAARFWLVGHDVTDASDESMVVDILPPGSQKRHLYGSPLSKHEIAIRPRAVHPMNSGIDPIGEWRLFRNGALPAPSHFTLVIAVGFLAGGDIDFEFPDYDGNLS